jgi:hypothetical protein
MKKRISIFLLLAVIASFTFAQFDPEQTGKSLVRIMVKGFGTANVCSGFIWEKDEWIVTSLHAMKKNGIIQVQYLNNYWRDAVVIKTLPKCDLVLLKTNLSERPLPYPVKAINSFSSNVKFPDKIYAQGYHGGAEGYRTQSLEKGHANPETIEYLVVKEESKQLVSQLGVPQKDLPILYLNGSLLPGYSGAPIYNVKGELIGIGDGGLEGGQVNVSWAIPAYFIDDLVNSPSSKLPDNIEDLELLFSASIKIKVDSEDNEEIQKEVASYYQSYAYGDFIFYKTKTRSFQEMYNSSVDPENLSYFQEELKENNIQIDYDQLEFDIYEDVENDVIIAVPEGAGLLYDETNQLFQTDLSYHELGGYFALEFTGLTGDMVYDDIDVAVDDLLNLINQAYGPLVNGFYEDVDYSYVLEIDESREIAYILFSGNNFFINDVGTQLDFKIYMTVLLDDSKVFYTLSTIYLPVYELGDAFTYGIDCVNNYNEVSAEYCDYFELLMHVIASSHLTTFANTNILATKK